MQNPLQVSTLTVHSDHRPNSNEPSAPPADLLSLESKNSNEGKSSNQPHPHLTLENVRTFYLTAHKTNQPVMVFLMVEMEKRLDWNKAEVENYLNDFCQKSKQLNELFDPWINLPYFYKEPFNGTKTWIVNFLFQKAFAESYQTLNVPLQKFPQQLGQKFYNTSRELSKRNPLHLLFAARFGLYEFLMAFMTSRHAKEILSQFISDYKWKFDKNLIIQTITAYSEQALNYEQTMSLLTQYKKFGIIITEEDLITAIKTKNARLVKFLIENFKFPQGSSTKYQISKQAAELLSWDIIDLLFKNNLLQNNSEIVVGFPPRRIYYSLLLRRLAFEGKIDAVKGLVARGAAFCFEPKEYAVLPPENKTESNEIKRLRAYLHAIKAIKAGNFNGSYAGIDPADKVDLEAYQKTSSAKPSNTQSTLETKEVNVVHSSLPTPENPLLVAVQELIKKSKDESRESKDIQKTTNDKLEQAYQKMLELGVFNLTEVIETVLTQIRFLNDLNLKKCLINFLIQKYISLYPDPDVFELLKLTKTTCLLHVLIDTGLFDIINSLFKKNATYRSPLPFNLPFKDVDSRTTVTHALQAFTAGIFTFDQTLLIIQRCGDFVPTEQDLNAAVVTKNLILFQNIVERCDVKDVKKDEFFLYKLLFAAVDQITSDSDWAIVDFLTRTGVNGIQATLNRMLYPNEGDTDYYIVYCDLLNIKAASDDVRVIKGLLLRDASYGSLHKDVFKKVKNNSRSQFYLSAYWCLERKRTGEAQAWIALMPQEDRDDLQIHFRNEAFMKDPVQKKFLFPPIPESKEDKSSPPPKPTDLVQSNSEGNQPPVPSLSSQLLRMTTTEGFPNESLPIAPPSSGEQTSLAEPGAVTEAADENLPDAAPACGI